MTDTFDAVLAKPSIPDTYSHDEIMFRHDKETKWVRREDFDWHMKQQANRLSAAHAAEVAELRYENTQRLAELQGQQARAEATERDAREAVGLLEEVSRNGWGKLGPSDLIHESPLLERIDAFLAAIATTKQAAGGAADTDEGGD